MLGALVREIDFRLVLDAFADAIIASDPSDTIIYANAAAETLFGWPRAELIGKPLTFLMPERMHQAHEAGFHRFVQTRRARIVGKPVRVPAQHRDGRELDVELTLAAYDTAEGLLIAAAFRDLRDRVELERQLVANQRLEAQYEVMRALNEATDLQTGGARLVEVIARRLQWDVGALWLVEQGGARLRSAAVFAIDPVRLGAFVEATARLELLRGEGVPGMVLASGQPLWTKDVTVEPGFKRAKEAAASELRGAVGFPASFGGEVRAVVEFFSREIREPDEELVRTLALLGAQLGHFLARMEAEAEERRRRTERENLLAELRSAVAARDEFLSVASHELKTPLTPLALKIDTLERLIRNPSSANSTERLTAALETMRKQLKRLNALIGDLLDVSRIGAGRLSLSPERLDLVALVREVTARVEDQARKLGCPLRLAAPEGPLWGQWDPMRLEQVVFNLLDNAVKYGRGRPVEVEVEPRPDGARLRITDHGIGIAEDDLQRIFRRFERAVSDRNYGGLGLGLYIVRTLVEAMGGTIGVESTPGQGARFTVTLPAQPPPASEESAERYSTR